jgi:hypothetical protein
MDIWKAGEMERIAEPQKNSTPENQGAGNPKGLPSCIIFLGTPCEVRDFQEGGMLIRNLKQLDISYL